MRTEISNISKNYFVLSELEGKKLTKIFQLYYKGTQNNNEATLLLNAIHDLTKIASVKNEEKFLKNIISKCDKAISLFTAILPNIPTKKSLNHVNKSYNLCMGYLEQLIDLKENLLDLIEFKSWPTDFDKDLRVIRQEIDPGIIVDVPKGLKCTNGNSKEIKLVPHNGKVLLFNDGANYYYLVNKFDDEKNFILINEVIKKLNIESLKWCAVDEYSLLPETGKLEVSHVQQGEIGDCFLISAIIGMVNKDPYLISRRIYEDGENVYVKFFDVKHGNQSYFVKTDKKIVRLKYSTKDELIKDKLKRLASSTPYLWPAILEKAYAIFASKHLLPDDQPVPTSNKSALKILQFGYTNIALSSITGKNYTRRAFHGLENSSSSIKFLNDYALWSAAQIEIASQILEKKESIKRLKRKEKNEPDFSLIDSLVFWERVVPHHNKTGITTFDRAFPLIKNWCKFLKEMKIKYFFEDRLERAGIYQETLRLEDFLKLLNGLARYKNSPRRGNGVNIPSGLKKPEIEWINDILITDQVFPKKRGTFVYSQYQLGVFLALKEVEHKNQIFLINSDSNRRTDRSYYFINTSHGYVFLKTEEFGNEKYVITIDPNGNPEDNNETTYQQRRSKNDVIRPPTPRILKMDLSDFTKRFDAYTILRP